jgi:hypothetical protein
MQPSPARCETTRSRGRSPKRERHAAKKKQRRDDYAAARALSQATTKAKSTHTGKKAIVRKTYTKKANGKVKTKTVDVAINDVTGLKWCAGPNRAKRARRRNTGLRVTKRKIDLPVELVDKIVDSMDATTRARVAAVNSALHAAVWKRAAAARAQKAAAAASGKLTAKHVRELAQQLDGACGMLEGPRALNPPERIKLEYDVIANVCVVREQVSAFARVRWRANPSAVLREVCACARGVALCGASCRADAEGSRIVLDAA